MAHACNPSTLGGQGGTVTCSQHFETSLGNIVRPHLYKKFKKLVRYRGTCLESQLLGRLRWEDSLGQEVPSMVKLLHSSRGDKEGPCLLRNGSNKLVAVAHAYNSSTLGGQGGWIT